jgi:predicted nucleotidyltransferase
MNLQDVPIAIDRKRVAEFCRAKGIRRLSLFGSVLRDDFDPESSDVDVLAEFKPGALQGVGWDYVSYGEELGRILGRAGRLLLQAAPLAARTGGAGEARHL